MPHGESWFSFLPFYESLQHAMSEAFPPSYMEHSEHLGVQHVIAFTFVVLFLIGVAFYVNRRLQNTEANILPEGKVTFYGFIETIVGATYNMSSDLMGPKAAKYFLPLIGTCALVIFFSNALGLIPGFLPPTDNLNTTFAMAMVIFVVTHVYGVKEHGFVKYFSHFFGPKVPWWIAWFINPLMFFIELISHIVRPITLAIRLMANMTADHLVLGIFVSLFAGMGLVLLPVPVVFYLMGCLVITVQTLVFCLLSVIYITLAIQHEEEH
jgi:F-type H+-transporting ATPase subunit a